MEEDSAEIDGNSSDDEGAESNQPNVERSVRFRRCKHSLSVYRRYRDRFQSKCPEGKLVWDISRIITWIAIFGFILFLLTGLWNPLVAVSSSSMEGNIMTGDLVVVTAHSPGDPPVLADSNDIITVHESRQGNGSHWSFNEHGDVIAFQQADGDGSPIIHRAHFWVEEGERWVHRADGRYLEDPSDTCRDVEMCPAPNAGYITAGDNNPVYDQVDGRPPVTESRIIGVAEFRIPLAGYLSIGIRSILPW